MKKAIKDLNSESERLVHIQPLKHELKANKTNQRADGLRAVVYVREQYALGQIEHRSKT